MEGGMLNCRDMPMDYDDNEFSIHNVELTEEGSSTVSPVLRPYDFEDGGHLSFDSLVENEVFLGITGQEDNQWIEEYSRGTSSSVVESRHDNVWSEAASSESVEMLLKSVGQGTLVTESSDEPGSLATNMDPTLKQDDEYNRAQEAMVTNNEEEGALATEEMDVSDEPFSLSINLDPNLKQEDESNRAREEMITNKGEEGALVTEELDVSDEPGSLSINLDPNLKQEDDTNHAQETNVTNKEEEGALATEELDVSDEPGSLAINMNHNLKRDDGNNHAQEAIVTNKEVGALVTEELDASDDPGNLTTNKDPVLKQDDGNNHAHGAMIINKAQDHFSGSNASFDCDKFYVTITKDSQEEAKASGGELDSDVLDNKCDLCEEKVDGICDDVNHEARNIAVELSENKLQEDLSPSKRECENMDASKECNLKKCPSSNEAECSTKNMNNPIGNHTAVETCTNRDEKPSNVESPDKPSFSVDIPVDEESMPAGNCNLLMAAACAEVSHDSKCVVAAFPEACELNNDLMHEDLPPVAAEDDKKTKSDKGSNVESLDKPPFAIDISVDEESMPAGSCKLLMTEGCAEVSHDSRCAVTAFPEACKLNNDLMHEDLTPVAAEDDDKTKSDNLASLESIMCLPSTVSDVPSRYIKESEKPDNVFGSSEMGVGSNIKGVATNMTNTCSSRELITGNMDLVATPKAHSGNSNKDQSPAAKLSGSLQQQVNNEIQLSGQDGGMCMDRNFTFHEERNTRLPSDMDNATLDSQQNVASVSSAEGCKAQKSEADIIVLAEPGYIDAKSLPILGGVSPVHHDNEGKKEQRFISDGTCENEPLKVVSSMVDCASLSVVEPGASPDSAGEVVHETAVEIMNDLAEEANPNGLGGCSTPSTVDPIPCDSSAKVGDNVEAGGSMDEIISRHHVNMSIDQHASSDVVLTSEFSDSHMRHGEDSSVSMNKLQSVSSLLDTNNSELSQSTRVKLSECDINEDTPLPEAAEDVVLTSECDDRHMRHEEDSSISMDKLQSVSSCLNTSSTIVSQGTRVKSSEGAIDYNTSLPEVTEDMVLTSEGDDSHMRHAEDSSVSLNKIQSVSPLLNTNIIELSQSTRVKPSEGAIDDNTSLPEATEDVVLTSGCDDSHMRHEEDSPVYVDELQYVSPPFNTNNTELSHITRVKPIDSAIDENTSLREETKDVMLTSGCDDSHTRHEEDSPVAMDKLQSVSPPLNTNNTELSHSKRVKPSEDAIDENISLPEATKDVVLTSECDDSDLRPREGSAVSMDKFQSVFLLLNTNNTKLIQSTKVKPSEGAINEKTSLPEATEDVVLTSECDDSHLRHEEASPVSMDKLQSVSSLSNTNDTELSLTTRLKLSECDIGENTPLPGAADNVVLTSECDDSHMRHAEDPSVSMDKLQSVSPLLNSKITELSRSTRVKLSEGAVNESTPLQEAAEEVVLTSECDDNHVKHKKDSSVSSDKLHSVSPNINSDNTEHSQSTGVKPSDGAIIDNASLLEATGDLQEKEQSFSLNSDTKIDKSFTFEVSATAGLREPCKGLQLFSASQTCNLSMTMEVPCIDSSSSTLDPRKPKEAHVVTPQTPGSGTIHSGAKERKTRRKSAGKESVRKGKETTSIRPGRVEKSSPLLVTPPQPAEAACHAIQFQELGPKEKVECSITKPISVSNLPDLNNSTCIFHQPFTNNQQVQLRAQILVYGSLISGMPPEEPHMIAAFGQSDAGRKIWEDAWHACLERAHALKSQAKTPVMQQPRSDLKDAGHRTPDLGIKHSSTLSSANKGTPPHLIPVPSPLWNMSTPSCAGLQSRSAAFQHPFTPIHPPNFPTSPNPLWLSQSPFLGQWGVASSPGSAAPQFSGLPITEAVKLTPVKVSGGGPHTYSMPVGHSTLFSSLSTDGKKASNDSKSRKRKKVTAAVSSVPSQVLMTPSADLVPRTGGHNLDYNRIPFRVENQTDSVTAPVTSFFSTSVTVSTPPASKSSSPGRFLSVHDHPRLGDGIEGNEEDMLLNKVEEGHVQEADVNAAKIWQPSSDSRSLKRTKVATNLSVNQTPFSTQTPPVVAYLPQVLCNEISSPAQNRTISVTAPAFYTSFPTSVALSTPITIYPTASAHGYPRTGYQNKENAPAVEETLSKVKESKLQAESAALLAATEVSNCQDVWSRLDSQNSSGVISDAEAKLISSMTSAASVAKMASAAAKIASIVAEEAKLMADEAFLSSKTESLNRISRPNVVNKATPASILKSGDKTTDSHPNSIISAAREAARRRIEAASAASKHAENLDAIVKTAELAAEAVSQVGKIVAMSDSLALRKLAEAGPEGFWKTSQLTYEQHQGGEISGLHVNSNSCKKNVPDVLIKEIQTLKHGQAPPLHLAHNQMKAVIDDGSVLNIEKDTRTCTALNLSKAVGVCTETNIRSPHDYVVGHRIPQFTLSIWEEHNIKEGCLVEVYKEDGKYKGAWLAANVLSLKDEKALICYTGIRSSDEGPENVKEWVAFEVEGSEEVPRIRIAHPMTTMRFEGARKRRRTAVTDYAWSKGDKVDVWMQDCWREGIVVEPNKIDVTSLTVQFPAQGEASVVRSWHVRPTLIWTDRKWIELKGGCASQSETPKEKRMKVGSPAAANDRRKDKLPMIMETGRHEEQGTVLPLLSAQENCFNVGKSTNKPSSDLRTIQKERARVVFGVPKPGKKQKFMAVSTQYVDDRSNKNNTTNGSFKFSKPPGARASKNDAMENQVIETKSRLKARKPPVPWFRTTTSHDSEPTHADSSENSSSRQNQTQVGSSSTSTSNKRRDPAKGPAPKKAFTFTSKPKSEPLNRGKLQVAPKVEVKDKSASQVDEPRRSNRKIQPTSRLLEGLQSSLTISKIPSISHAAQRKVTSRGNTRHGSS